MKSETKKYKTKESVNKKKTCTLETDTFSLRAELDNHTLAIVLQDYVCWKIFAKKYTAKDLSRSK